MPCSAINTTEHLATATIEVPIMANTHSMPAIAPAQPPISRDFAQISAPNPAVRRLTVSYGARCVRGDGDGRPAPAPLLRLQGAITYCKCLHKCIG